MLPTFVIGLREGLEAALIVGIIAAFLRKQGRRDLLRWVWLGVGTAILLCVAAGVALNVLSKDLPQRQQEGLETVIGALAVGMVTYMVIWMKRNSRGLKGQLEGMAADAMGGTSRRGAGHDRDGVPGRAARGRRDGDLPARRVQPVRRAAPTPPSAPRSASSSRSCSATASTAAACGSTCRSSSGPPAWCSCSSPPAWSSTRCTPRTRRAGSTSARARTVDLTWLVDPGSVQASLLTGMLGLQSRPVVIEVIGWLVYLVPGRPVRRLAARPVAGPPLGRPGAARLAGAVLGVVAVVLAVVMPGRPADRARAPPARRSVSIDRRPRSCRWTAARLTLQQTGASRARRRRHCRSTRARQPGTKAAALPTTVSYSASPRSTAAGCRSGSRPTPAGAHGALHRHGRASHGLDRAAHASGSSTLRSTERITAAVVDPSRGTLAAEPAGRHRHAPRCRPPTARAAARAAAERRRRRWSTARCWPGWPGRRACSAALLLLAGAGAVDRPRAVARTRPRPQRDPGLGSGQS